MKPDPVNKPSHYRSHPSGYEAIVFSEQMNFCLGNAFKYLYRCGLKGSALEDLKKAEWYAKREFDNRFDLYFTWEPPSDAELDEKTEDMLDYENRYIGFMSAALRQICLANKCRRSQETLLHALDNIRHMIKIELRKEARNESA